MQKHMELRGKMTDLPVADTLRNGPEFNRLVETCLVG